jgi:hypothetical protein
MSCGRLTAEVQRRLTAISTTEAQVEWFTDWIPCTGIDSDHAPGTEGHAVV